MSEEFDPYHVWLGIPPEEQPANRYRLLGIRLFESNPGVIDNAADRQMAHLRTVQAGAHATLSQRLLNEVSAARVCLLNPEAKAAYDQRLRAAMPAVPPPPPASNSAIGPTPIPSPSGSQIHKNAATGLPIAQVIPAAPSVAAPEAATDWDNLIGDPANGPNNTGRKSRPSTVVPRTSGNRLIYVCAGAGVLLAAAVGIAFFALGGPAEAVLKFNWPAADRAGVALTVDNQPVAIPAAGPWEYRCPPGEHRIVAQRPAFKFETAITLAAGDQPAIAADWKPKALLMLKWPLAERTGTQLLVDGYPQHQSQSEPLELPVDPGRHVVHITRPESEPFETAVSIANDQRSNVAVALAYWPTLVLDLPPEQRQDSTLSIDNDPVTIDASAAKLDFRLKPGAHTIHLARSGFKPYDVVATLSVGDSTPLTPIWQPLTTHEQPSGKPVTANETDDPNKNAPARPDATSSDKKMPVPTVAAQAESLKSVKDTFKSDYAKKTPADEVALAEKLFDAALDTDDDPTERFTLLCETRDLAARAGNLDLMVRAIDRLASEFDVDALEMKLVSLTESARSATTPAANNAIAAEALCDSEDAAGTDRYVVAHQYAALLKSVSRKTNDKQLIARADRADKDIVEVQKKNEAVASAIENLKEKPDDPEANLSVGMLQCFWKDQWNEGLPKLAKGSDPKLKGISGEELSRPQVAAEQAKLADSWWALAETETEPAKEHLKQRAAIWYRQALPGLSGLARARIEKRLQEAAHLSAAPSSTHFLEIDLLKLVDVKRDAVTGDWEIKNGALVCWSKEPSIRLELPYQPPEEYDFQIVFVRTDGYDAINQICVAANHKFRWVMDGFKNKQGFDFIDGKFVDANKTSEPLKLKNGQRYVSVVKVRKDRVQAFIDGRLVNELKTDYSDMSLWDGLSLRNPNTLGLATYVSPTIFYSVKVVEITGVGKLLQ